MSFVAEEEKMEEEETPDMMCIPLWLWAALQTYLIRLGDPEAESLLVALEQESRE